MAILFGYVYRTTNLANGKTYIGLRYYKSDVGKEWLDYLGSGQLIIQAVERYGRENFSKEKLAEANTREELQEL